MRTVRRSYASNRSVTRLPAKTISATNQHEWHEWRSGPLFVIQAGKRPCRDGRAWILRMRRKVLNCDSPQGGLLRLQRAQTGDGLAQGLVIRSQNSGVELP